MKDQHHAFSYHFQCKNCVLNENTVGLWTRTIYSLFLLLLFCLFVIIATVDDYTVITFRI